MYDTNRNGTITAAELGNSLVFNSTAGNPNGADQLLPELKSRSGPQDHEGSRRDRFFGQDEFTLNRWTFNLGLRAEQWSHYATTGESVFTSSGRSRRV